MCENKDTIPDRVFYEVVWLSEARFASIHPSQA